MLQKRIGAASTAQEGEYGNRKILFGDFVQPICLPLLDKTKTSYSQKHGCKFSGWTGGKSGAHYLVGHAAEINKAYMCQDDDKNDSPSKHNCLSVRSLSPPKFPKQNTNENRKSRNLEEQNSYENGMPLVCLASESLYNPRHNPQLTDDEVVDGYELMGLYSASKVLNTSENSSRVNSTKTKEQKNGLKFLNISPYISWIKVRLSL